MKTGANIYIVYLSILIQPLFIFVLYKRLTKHIGVPNNTQVTGMCGGGVATTQSISLMFYNDWLLNVIFSHTLATSPRHVLLDGTMYGIKEISLEYKVDSSLFPDADTTGKLGQFSVFVLCMNENNQRKSLSTTNKTM